MKKESARRGRRSTLPTTDLGKFIQQKLDSMKITRAQFAEKLGVSPATIGRLLNGDTKVVRSVNVQGMYEALELDDMDRRTFLQVIGAATSATFALATGVSVPKTARYRVDPDLISDHADALSRLLDEGQADYVRKSAQLWYDKLMQEPSKKDVRLGSLQIRFGILLGAAQEFTLPWYHRDRVAIQTYKSIEESVIERFGLNTFAHEHALLLSHQAPLHRAMRRFEESSKEFEDAIYWVRDVDDPRLRATLFRDRIHGNAVLGNELHWAYQLDEARKDAARTTSVFDSEIFLMLNYAEGEGLKRFAFNTRKELSYQVRAEYARRALQIFAPLHNDQSQQNMPQYLLMQVSEAQCLIWLDPYETIFRLQKIRNLAELFFPALLKKMDTTLLFAQKRLNACKGDSPLQFDLDAKLRARH